MSIYIYINHYSESYFSLRRLSSSQATLQRVLFLTPSAMLVEVTEAGAKGFRWFSGALELRKEWVNLLKLFSGSNWENLLEDARQLATYESLPLYKVVPPR